MAERSWLARWGRVVHRRRALILVLSALLLAASVAGLLRGGALRNTFPEDTEAGRGFRLLAEQLPDTEGASFVLLFSRPDGAPFDRTSQEEVERAVSGLRMDSRVREVRAPWNASGAEAAAMVSRDRTLLLVEVVLRAPFAQAQTQYEDLRLRVEAGDLRVQATGGLAINHDFERTLAEDLRRAEFLSLPASLLLLLLVFGTVVAALLPIGVGVLAVAGGVAAVLAFSHSADVATYAVNVVTLIGLGVAIDYSLFVVSRFREELAVGDGTEEALARTLATAGRATLFSGLTVAIGLSGLLFFQGSFLASMGAGGTLVVALAVLYALTFLPALLSLLGLRIERLRVPWGARPRREGRGIWHRLAYAVMRRPVAVLLPALVLLVAAGAPFLDLRMANGDVNVLPREAESRVAYETLRAEFPGLDATALSVVLEWPEGPVLSPERTGLLFDHSRALAALPSVLRVVSVVDLDPNLSRSDYQVLLASPPERQPEEMEALAAATVGERIAVLRVLTAAPAGSDEARGLLAAMRALPSPSGSEVHVTGTTAVDVDTIQFILDRVPAAVAFVVLTTLVLLLVLFGSVLLPFKAILMNLLSITASFGALVWIFQQGNLSAFLQFSPTSIDPTLPVIMFCVLFGLSMDYEVLLLSRIQEEHDRHGDNERAVAEGLQASGRLITGAAAIMVLVFSAFATSNVVIVKAIGLGLAIAVAVDASVVRALVVPSTMRLLGEGNWWGPSWLQRLRRRI